VHRNGSISNTVLKSNIAIAIFLSSVDIVSKRIEFWPGGLGSSTPRRQSGHPNKDYKTTFRGSHVKYPKLMTGVLWGFTCEPPTDSSHEFWYFSVRLLLTYSFQHYNCQL